MADSKPINWAYPFKAKAAAEGESAPGNATPELYYEALANAKDGFYPMGANGLWHGGVHFDEGTAGSLDQSAIHCIADGEVIAYRIDQRYPTTQYGEGPTVMHLPFSTGFVLVKHRLELPSVPAPSAAADAGETADTAPAATMPSTAPTTTALTFYSLYMHLSDWASYSNADAPAPPSFFGETLYGVKADKASDGVLGLRVRAAPKDGAVTALLPKGTKVKVGDADTESPAWHRLLSILEGSAIPALTGAELGWVYTSEMQAVTGEADTFLVADDARDAEPTLVPQLGLNVRKAANSGSTITGLLPVGAKCSLKAGTAAYRELQQIVEGQDIAPLSANSVHNIRGFVHFASLEASKAVPTLDSVHILPKPYPIKAGELVGHIGKYQNFDDARPRTMLHLEIFTSEDVPAFLAQSRAVAEKLPAEQKTLIKVDKGSKIIQPAAANAQIVAGADVRICSDSPKSGRWAKVQKYVTCNAQKTTELGSFATDFTYPLNAAQKTTLATRMGIEAADMPDKVDFLKVSFSSVEGGDPLPYVQGSGVPSTHLWRKVGAVVGEPLWVERGKLDAQGRRTSTAGALAAWSEFPLHSGIDGQACSYERILPAGSWNGLPDERKAIDPDKIQWWYVTVGDENGNDISGWAPEQPLIVTRHSPWEWPGFSTIQDKLPLDAPLARTLDATGRATVEETQSYAALIEEAERGEILGALYKVIDLPNEQGIRDNKLTPAELKTALGKPWLAQQLSLLISQHESEWFWNEGKWNQLDKLMEHTPADPNPAWVAEKKRIETLSWWKELAGQPGIAADGVAWHFQPVGILSAFSHKKACCELDIEKFDSIFGLGRLFTADNMPVTCDSYDVDRKKFIELLNKSFEKYEFKKCIYKIHFLAQCYHESDHFKTTMEYASGNDYDLSAHPATVCTPLTETSRTCKRHRQIMAEGNTTIGDGPKYKGKGLIQITWKSAYEKYKVYSGIDCVTNPQMLCESISHAVDVSFWFWTKFKGENLNSKIDRYYAELDEGSMSSEDKDKEVVRRITKVVNGGDNHLHERQALFKKIKEALR
nr:hypothetical protein [uncultured Pseudomonas sp.]